MKTKPLSPARTCLVDSAVTATNCPGLTRTCSWTTSWFFFAQPDKPERAILPGPAAWYGGDPERMGAENYADHQQAIRDPATVRAMLEDYRAGLTVDRAADQGRPGRRAARDLPDAGAVVDPRRP